MIVIEFYETRYDGVNLYRTYSSEGFQIERDGVLYDEAIDPEGTNRVYIETDIPREPELELKVPDVENVEADSVSAEPEEAPGEGG